MRNRRPEAITTMAIVNIIFGALSILCGGCGAFGLLFLGQIANAPGPGGGPNPVAQLLNYLNKECPGYQFVEVGRSVGILVLGVVLIAAAIGLLQMQSWGRWVTVAYAALAIPLHVGYLGYEMGVVLPATQRFTATMQGGPGGFGAQQNPGQQAGTAVGIVLAAGIAVVHAAANVIVMLLPAVGAAFAGPRRRRRRRDYDEDEDENDEDDRYRRPRRRPRDDDDEGIRPSRGG
jgi:hypothetical protein